MDKKYYDIKIIQNMPYVTPLYVVREVENLSYRVSKGHMVIEFDVTKIINVVNMKSVTIHHALDLPTLEGYQVIID